MNRNLLSAALAATLFAAGVASAASPFEYRIYSKGVRSPVKAAPPAVDMAVATLTFGPVQIGTTLRKTVTLTNSGGTALKVTGLLPTTGELVATPSADCASIAPQASCTIEAAYTPASAAAFDGAVSFSTNADAPQNSITIPASGQGVYYVAVTNGARLWADGTVAHSCKEYLTGDSTHAYGGATGDGVYKIQPPASNVLTVYCDMSTDGGGWSLVAVTSSNSTAHLTAAAVGAITAPTTTSVATVAKLSDAQINAIPKTYYRMTGAAGAIYKGYFDGTTAFTSAPNGSAGSMPSTRSFTLPVATPLLASPTWSPVYTQAPSHAGITSADNTGANRNGGPGGAIYGAAPSIAIDYMGSAFVDTDWTTGSPNNNITWDRTPFTRGTHHRGTGVNIWVK